MPNACSDRTGDLELSALCEPDPIPVAAGQHKVSLENSGTDPYYVGEIQVHILNGSAGSALLLERNGLRGHVLSIEKLGTYGQWGHGTWQWAAERQGGAAQSEAIRTTVTFDRSAALDPLDPDALLGLHCACDVDVTVQ